MNDKETIIGFILSQANHRTPYTTEKTDMYAVIQKGFYLFGTGATPEEAVKEANQWLDHDDNVTLEELETYYEVANHGEMVLIEASKKVHEKVLEEGGDFLYEVERNKAYLEEELES